MLRLAFVPFAALAVLFAVPVLADAAAIAQVEVGFAGVHRAGQWTPLRVDLSGEVPESVVIETVTADADGTSVVQQSEAVGVERRGSSATAATVFQSGRAESGLTVRIRDAEGAVLAERRIAAKSETLSADLSKGAVLWVVATGSDETAPFPLPDGVTAAMLSGMLPVDPRAYAAADLLILRGDAELSELQAEAVRRWVVGGGRLAVALGRHTEFFRGGLLAPWMPMTIGEPVLLRDVSSLENFPRRARLRIAQLGGAATVFPVGADTPLVAHGPYGFGRVTLFAMDLDTPPFSTWAGLPDLVRRSLLGRDRTTEPPRGVGASGISDLTTQMLRAEEVFPGVRRSSVGTTMLWLLLLAAIVGPLDYLIVHRVLRRPALTWLTLPLIVAATGWWLHRSAVAANGSTPQFNELHFVDVDATTGTLRGRSDVALYSTSSMRVDLSVLPKGGSAWGLPESKPTPYLSWLAPPEMPLGGTFRTASGGLFHPEYVVPRTRNAAEARRIPMLVWSSRHFSTAWQGGDAAGLIRSDLRTANMSRLSGTMTHHLPGPLSDVRVAFGKWFLIARPGVAWYPGEALDLESFDLDRQELNAVLTRKTTTHIERKPGEGGEDYIVSESAYDPFATDISDIVSMLTFHEAAGGTGYTGLTNSVRSRDDLSAQLTVDRAVVLGRLDTPASTVEITTESDAKFERARQDTFVRFVLPIARTEAALPSSLAPLAPTDADSERPRPPRP